MRNHKPICSVFWPVCPVWWLRSIDACAVLSVRLWHTVPFTMFPCVPSIAHVYCRLQNGGLYGALMGHTIARMGLPCNLPPFTFISHAHLPLGLRLYRPRFTIC